MSVPTLQLTAIQVLGIACAGLFIGAGIKRLFPVLARLSIPGSVLGGLVYAVVSLALRDIRKAKSAAKASMRTDVATAVVRGSVDHVERARQVAGDLAGAGRIQQLSFEPGSSDEPTVEVTL